MSKDTIYREDAIKLLVDRACEKPDHGASAEYLMVDEIEYYLKNLPSADRLQVWIPCSERLPSEKDYIGDVVIWCTDKSIVGVGWYYESTKSWATIDDTFPPILGEVIAWMPLPKPWKGADDEYDK